MQGLAEEDRYAAQMVYGVHKRVRRLPRVSTGHFVFRDLQPLNLLRAMAAPTDPGSGTAKSHLEFVEGLANGPVDSTENRFPRFADPLHPCTSLCQGLPECFCCSYNPPTDDEELRIEAKEVKEHFRMANSRPVSLLFPTRDFCFLFCVHIKVQN